METEIIKIGQNNSNKAPLTPYDILGNGLPKVFISSDSITISGNTINGLTTSKNEVNCKILITSADGNIYDDGKIAYQGNTSLLDPLILKKGFTLDFNKKHRFKNWREYDSFHLKGYYSDWTHARDLICNRILEAMYNTREESDRRPYMGFNGFTPNWYANTDVSILCHIDGFPVELYINDTYWGLYSLNIKKSRDNYLLSKNNVNHIQVEAADDMTYTTSGLDWTKLEIRNPKSDSGNTSFEEGVEPNDGEVKTAWVNFISYLTSITLNTTKADLESHLNMREFIDSMLFYDFVRDADSWCKNTLYTTWDGGTHWAPLIYDLDVTLGINTIYGDSAAPYNSDNNAGKANTRCPWLPIIRTIFTTELESRYAELRQKGIFTWEFVTKLLDDFTKEVGYDAYKRDIARWPGYPSLGNPRQEGGVSNNFYESTTRICTFIKKRLTYLDGVYHYNG